MSEQVVDRQGVDWTKPCEWRDGVVYGTMWCEVHRHKSRLSALAVAWEEDP